jgi:hypothetical protein
LTKHFQQLPSNSVLTPLLLLPTNLKNMGRSSSPIHFFSWDKANRLPSTTNQGITSGYYIRVLHSALVRLPPATATVAHKTNVTFAPQRQQSSYAFLRNAAIMLAAAAAADDQRPHRMERRVTGHG